MGGMNGRKRALAYNLCKKRSGEVCAHCGRKGNKKTLSVCRRDLEIQYDLPDGRNWELRCGKCSHAINPRNCKPLTRYRSFASIGEMLGFMIDTIYARRNPGPSIHKSIADKLMLTETILDQMIKGEAICSVQTFCAIARLTKCSKVAFDWLKEYGQ